MALRTATTPSGAPQGERPAFALVEGYMVATVLAGLEMIGLLDPLEADGLGEEATNGRDGEASALLRAALDYLLQRGVLQRSGERFELTSLGRAACEDKGYLLWLSGGYGEPLRKLDAFFEGSARYGAESVRDGRWVARGSALLGARDVVPEAMGLLEQLSFEQVLDLGCGNGRFLISVCERFDADGVGIDLSPEACEEAEQAAAAAGLAQRVRFVLGDAVDLDVAPLERTQLVIAFFLLHEIYSIGRDALVELLRSMTARLPGGAHLLVAEVEPAAQRDLNGAWFTPEFTFVHAMMRQRLIPEQTWCEALTEGGFEIEAVLRPRQPGGLLLLARTPVR